MTRPAGPAGTSITVPTPQGLDDAVCSLWKLHSQSDRPAGPVNLCSQGTLPPAPSASPCRFPALPPPHSLQDSLCCPSPLCQLPEGTLASAPSLTVCVRTLFTPNACSGSQSRTDDRAPGGQDHSHPPPPGPRASENQGAAQAAARTGHPSPPGGSTRRRVSSSSASCPRSRPRSGQGGRASSLPLRSPQASPAWAGVDLEEPLPAPPRSTEELNVPHEQNVTLITTIYLH